ncbi:MAG TPA: lysoplasmalogenase family protein [Verrucomicrobiae bacterium]|nr:lysoplasmalogenase family protein [Verrucomicrobiae bacterium]
MPGLLLAAAAAALLDLAAAALGWASLRELTKPLPALLLAILAARSAGVPRLFPAGLVLAAAGDELLLRPGDAAFAAGMAAFAAMHVCYIVTFGRLGKGPGLLRRVPSLVLPFAAAVLGTNLLLAGQAGSFALPVALYSVLLGAMAACACDAAGRLPRPAGLALAAGALLFMLSDTALAFATFWPGFALHGNAAEIAIVGVYFAAQIAIAGGVCSAAATAS